MKTIGGTLVGLASGAAIGYLTAPDKGVKTRKRLRKDAARLQEDLEDAATNKLNEAKEILNEKVDVLSAKTYDGIDSIKDKVKVA